ncbi:MAG: hypothetical protein K9M98_11950 [Cephaloticoccus sp.]|nr:hypothetical protein [Cephaloticoccus sp.]MCF7761206.1 hypothetical protein [Cephaloticoccus sp.]
MKIRILAVLVLGTAAQALLATPHIMIGDVRLEHAFTPVAVESSLREYIPPGETSDHWTRLASFRIIRKEKDSKKYLTRLAETATQSNPMAKARFLQNDKGQTVLDTITFAPADSPVKFAQWGMTRAVYVKGTGLMVYQYAMRLYQIDAESAKLIATERERMMAPFVAAHFNEQEDPSIKPKEDLQSNVERLAREGWEDPTDTVN